ncbi:hypothetical protein LEP1GSC036_3766 [Leptospira weilii str. 2006001853]|uniref:Uncharacterized protein n=2 Tax=Leptospira weilii TaxID=28184 RepID=A0A828Z2J2_9LEPT|nr:hypothetical protein LEP1GSC036_3766 [Leptospira weilii str. 2006001853]EMM74551.1 hypothetical protein LEP1GSC038_4553 [Leptospira weilii str. 2006001855]EMN45784.1 hypothetical protein LEP1GSC086_2349 [Leptospira weilii str. LNT 1234]
MVIFGLRILFQNQKQTTKNHSVIRNKSAGVPTNYVPFYDVLSNSFFVITIPVRVPTS